MNSIKRTEDWLDKIVIDLSLCPFAAKVYHDNNILFISIDFTNIEASIDTIQNAIQNILNPNTNFTTCLIIYESGLEIFQEYLDVYYIVEEWIQKSNFSNKIQLASFHPDYQFEGTQKSDVENYTNRSPFPIIHLLRTEDVTTAIESHPDIESVPIQNIIKMKALSAKEITVLFDL